MKQSITQKSLIDQFVKKFFLLFILGIGLSSNAQNTLNTLGLSASTPASAAYSLRQLSSGYTGSAIQVRRSSDNTTQNIGFTASGDLDQAALLAFVGTGNGFVSIWYDQSGNGRNAIQNTLANQPRIVNAGVVETQNSKPTLFL
ncbi:MAG: arabinofuranosidase catalytic domain-containing protein, partial [Bacteroidota bacterium]